MDIEEKAKIALSFVEEMIRRDKQIVVLKDDRPDWLHELVVSAHNGTLPDDWTYEAIRAALQEIASGQDDGSEWADSRVDVYNAVLYDWATPARWADIDSACDDIAWPRSMAEIIQRGQCRVLIEIWDACYHALEAADIPD